MTITHDKLRSLIQADEGQYHDRKSMFVRTPGQRRPRDRREVRDQIAEQVAGFANAEGGIVIFGVDDDGTITGHVYPPDQIDVMLAVPQNRLVPPQAPGYRVTLDDHELLVFAVESAPRAVMVTGDGYPYRIGDETVAFSEEKINRIKEQGLVESTEARRSSVSQDGLDWGLVSRACSAGGNEGESPDAFLVRRRLADRMGAAIVLREAAVLLFAAQPETIAHPNAGIRVFRVAGTERLVGARHNVQEFPRIEGNLPSVLAQARTLLETLIQRSARLHDLFFQEEPEYPTFAWQEALVNAVAHRDYGIQGQGVEVWLFDDRLEVLSPGGLAPEVSIDDLRAGTPAHASRNPRIARVLADLGVMRDQGEGIPRMFEEMESSFLPLPEFDIDRGSFRVRLRNHPIYKNEDPAFTNSVRALPLSLTQKRAVVGLVDREFTNADYAGLNALDRDASYREIHELIERGLVRSTGAGAGTRYSVIRDAVVPPRGTASTPQARLVDRMREAGFITNADYREAFGVDRKAARNALRAWVAAGFIDQQGERRGTRYVPGESWPPA